MERYDSVNRKQRRIGDSVCFWGGKPVYVKTSSPWRDMPQPLEDEVLIKDLETWDVNSLYDKKGWEKVNYTDDRFSASATEMGYINTGKGTSYCARFPARHPQQGISFNNIKGGADVFGKPMADMLMGKYPTFDEAMKLFKDEHRQAIAFSRYFAIQRLGKEQITLQFHDRAIGLWDAGKQSFVLFPGREVKLIASELKETGVNHVISTEH